MFEFLGLVSVSENIAFVFKSVAVLFVELYYACYYYYYYYYSEHGNIIP